MDGLFDEAVAYNEGPDATNPAFNVDLPQVLDAGIQ